ncbi:MAG: IclR family transcriptional regulator [Devosia sp.]|nr:IclR family transcriptional regulator [Devosia sp.]
MGEIYRMLVVLQRRGLVALDPAGDRYYLTTKLFEMANRTPVIARLTVAAAPIMADLANATDESVHLAVLSDESIIVIGQVDNPGYNIMRVRLGARIPAWKTSSGRVLLANLPEDRLEAFLADHPHPDGLLPARLRRELGGIRRRGYEQMRSYVVKGVTNISAPIMSHAGFAAAAMTIPYVDRHFGSVPIDECREILMRAAADLSRAIGGTSRPASASGAG